MNGHVDFITIAGGYEVKSDGDSFMVAFSSVFSAVTYCMSVQEALLGADWPEGCYVSLYKLTMAQKYWQLRIQQKKPVMMEDCFLGDYDVGWEYTSVVTCQQDC